MTEVHALEKFQRVLQTAVPQFRGMEPFTYNNVQHIRMRFAPIDGSSRDRYSYILGATVEAAVSDTANPSYLLFLAAEAVAFAYSCDELVARRHIQDLLYKEGYFSLAEPVNDGVRVWFSGKKTGRLFYVAVDKRESSRIADGITDATDIVHKGIEMLETEPGRKM